MKTVAINCQHCAHEMTVTFKTTPGFQCICNGCNKMIWHDIKLPHLYWTLCEPCKFWVGHEKYMTSIECHKCGQVLKTI